MRPQLIAADNAGILVNLIPGHLASMRPQLIAADNAVPLPLDTTVIEASMRPQLIAADNQKLREAEMDIPTWLQ